MIRLVRRRGRPALLAAGALLAIAAVPAAAQLAVQQPVPYAIDLQPAFTPVAHEIRWFHHTIVLPVIIAVVAFVLLLLGVCVVRFSSKANPTPTRTTHHVGLEVAWTVVPILILIVIAIPSFQLLYRQQTVPPADLTVKVTGNAWNWTYAYPDSGAFEFRSVMLNDQERAQAAQALGRTIDQMPRLLAVDNEMVVPVNRTVRLQITSSDVIHSFAMPSFGIKVDAIPGRLNEGWFRAERAGLYYGQCSELCGRDHAFMPIAIRVVTDQEYTAWVEDARRRFAGDPPATRVAALGAER